MQADPRDIANLVLDVADRLKREVTNLALNKIVYFLHGNYLARYNEPLVDATIEAWQYGPVFREIYYEFKRFEDRPITAKAQRIDPADGLRKTFVMQFPPERQTVMEDLAQAYLNIRPGRLVDMSHVEDGPWYDAWNYEGTVNPGMAISDEAIEAYFSQKVRH